MGVSRQHKYQLAYVAAGRCCKCGRERGGNAWLCDACRDKLNRLRRRKRALGLYCDARPNHKARKAPPRSKFAPKAEPSAEEVERLVAEGYAKLPAWWHESRGG